MKTVKARDGTEVIILSENEIPELNTVWFYEQEWSYAKKLISAIHDPEEKKSFLETLVGKKKCSTDYLITSDFPLDLRTEPKMPDNFMVDFVGGIIETLKKEGKL